MKKQNVKKVALFTVAGLIVLGFIGFGIFKILNSNDKFSSEDGNTHNQNWNYQINVLNGCGVEDVAFQITQYLRIKGFDVVDYDNYETIVSESFIIDHVGKPDIAKLIAKELGIDERKIVESKSRYYNEFTVVIGKDYIMLKPFKNKFVD